jgi:hypothetical protein
VRFVEDDRVESGQQLADAFVAKHEIGKEKVVIDDDHVGFERVLARLHHEALVEVMAVTAEAVLARRGHMRPYRRGLGDAGAIGFVACRRRAREALDQREVARVVAAREARVRRRALKVMVTHVIRAAFEQRDADRQLERVPHGGNVAVEKLVLQGLGPGRDDDLAARAQRRHEIRESLAGAGAGLRDEDRMAVDRRGDGTGHFRLAWAGAKAGHDARQRAVSFEYPIELEHAPF